MTGFGSVRSTNRRKVLDCIESHGDGIAVRDIAAELRLENYEVRGHVTRLFNDGKILPADPLEKIRRWRRKR